jgi:hypothetical protein
MPSTQSPQNPTQNSQTQLVHSCLVQKLLLHLTSENGDRMKTVEVRDLDFVSDRDRNWNFALKS